MGALRFTKSKDGATRATVRVSFRVEPGSVALALAIDAMASLSPDDDTGVQWHGNRLWRQYTKAKATDLVRMYLYVHGPVEQWPEDYSDEFAECLEAAADYVNTILWPGVGA